MEIHYSLIDFLPLLGALGLFLFGMKMMSDALGKIAGDKMRVILSTMTANRFRGVLTGFLITAVLQSSSATTLMVVGFTGASLLTLAEAIGVIMGANIGTTVTAWLITLLGFKVKVSTIALTLAAPGFLLYLSQQRHYHAWGTFTIGFAILFIGLDFLKNGVPPLDQYPQLLNFLANHGDQGWLSILLFLLAGTLLTALLQSSSAVLALVLVMCHEGWISFPMAAAMVLGSNLGTTVTAAMAALVANHHAKRAAGAHFIFNMIGTLWVLLIFSPFLQLIDWLVQQIGSASPFSQSMAIPLALSIFHTAFNLLNTLFLIGFLSRIAQLVVTFIPRQQKETDRLIEQPRFLNKQASQYPQTAMVALLSESKRLFESAAFQVIAHGLNVHRSDITSRKSLKEIVGASSDVIEIDINQIYAQRIKIIYGRIVEFAAILKGKHLLDAETIHVIDRIAFANRHIVEVVKNMEQLHQHLARHAQSHNPAIRQEYNDLRRMILRVIREIHRTKKSAQPENHLKKLVRLRKQAKQSDVLRDGSIERLIRDHKIDSNVATSLMNDSATVSQICHHLVLIAELLYIDSDTA